MRLVDAENATLSYESRFDLAYNYRSENRHVVFQALVHTLGGCSKSAVRLRC